MGYIKKDKLFTEWKTIETAIDDGTLVAIQKESEIYLARQTSYDDIEIVTRDTGNVRYKSVADK